MEKIFVAVVLFISVVNGLYIGKDDERSEVDHADQPAEEDKFANIINSWMEYKRKFQPFMDPEDSYKREERFNELEVLEMIPSVIAHYRAGEISAEDEVSLLSQIYGNLWTIIVQEAKRKSAEEMDPILKALIDSFYLTRGAMNDVEYNTVRRVMTKATKPRNKLLLKINKKDHPSQRVLNTAAMLIHYDRNRGHSRQEREVSATEEVRPNKSRVPRTASINLQLSNIPIERITKTKRNVNIHLRGNNLVDSKIDTLLKMNGDRIDSMEFDDEYDEDYDEKERSVTDDNDKEMMDYLYEDNYEYDEKAGSPSSDNEYGSFRDLIYLAAKHRLRREQEELKLKASKKYFLTLNDAEDH